MPKASDYTLRVTAGPSYDISTHQIVHVNTQKPVSVKSSNIDAKVHVRIQNFRGLPKGSPKTCAYFEHAPHKHDLYSISFSFAFPESKSINGNELLFGNDFEEPIRDKLPPGFNTAFRIVKWAIDPGLDGDTHADKPYLYGPLLSSINLFRVETKAGEKADEEEDDDDDEELLESGIISEGASGSGKKIREEKGFPTEGPARMKHFLTEAHRKDFTFEGGREYACDFFNPYLDFNEFSLQLPGFKLPIMGYWDGQPLRYTLIHRTPDGSTREPLLVISVALIKNENVEEEEKKWAGESTNSSEGKDSKDSKDGKEEESVETEGNTSKDTKTPEFVDEGVD